MKKIFTLIAAALMSASLFAMPATVPSVQDLTNAGYDVTARVICLYFDEQVYYDIVWAGSYNGWSTTPAEMMKFNPLEGFAGWYVIELRDDSDPCQGKPVQLKKDGSFSWDFQSGDVEAWINMAQPGTQTASFEAGNSGEANCTWPTTGAYIYEVEYFKNHNTPYVAHDYTITAYLPQFCDEIAAYADSVRVMGGFDNWTNGIWMEKKIDEDFNDCWYAEIKDVEEGTEFKLRFGTDADWAVQVQLDGKNLDNEMTGETTDIILQYDGVGYGFSVCGAPVARKEFVFVAGEAADADPAMFAITWGADGSRETVKMTKKEDGIYVAEILPTVDSVVLVRCATGATEIIWDENVWNQSEKYPLFDTMCFGEWTEEGNFTLEPLKPVKGDQFVDATSGLKFEVTAVGEANTVKVIANNYTGTSYTVPATVSYNDVTFAVTTIVDMAFYCCESLQSVTLSEGLLTIGEFAFAGSGLTSVTFLGNACQNNIGEAAFYGVGADAPALLTLHGTWAKENQPDEDGNWYGGKFELSEDPTDLPKVDKTGITVNGRKYGFPVRMVTDVE